MVFSGEGFRLYKTDRISDGRSSLAISDHVTCLRFEYAGSGTTARKENPLPSTFNDIYVSNCHVILLLIQMIQLSS